LPSKQSTYGPFTQLDENGARTETPNRPDFRNKAVVAFLDGRRLKGYIYNFSAQKDSFRLFFEQDTLQREGTAVQMKDLKAIFFARDFVGNSEYTESQILISQNGGRKTDWYHGRLQSPKDRLLPGACGSSLQQPSYLCHYQKRHANPLDLVLPVPDVYFFSISMALERSEYNS
jgi:hypothetical protein